MSEIRPNQASGTLSYVMAGLFWMQFPNSLPEKLTHPSVHLPFSEGTYMPSGSGATFDSYRGVVTGQYDRSAVKFEQAVGNFYAKLLLRQEPLGSEFEKVLYDNLWDLYES